MGMEGNDNARAVALYKSYIEKKENHLYINTFTQYEGWLIRTRFNMLGSADKKAGEDVAYIIDQMVDAEYKGYCLLYASLDYLQRQHVVSQSQINAWVEKIKSYSSNPALNTAGEKDVAEGPSNTMPQRDIEILARYNAQKADDYQYFTRIQGLGSR